LIRASPSVRFLTSRQPFVKVLRQRIIVASVGEVSGEQVRIALRQLHERAAVVHFQPAALDRQIEAGLVFRRRALVAEQKRALSGSAYGRSVVSFISG
jgi:hypothetical protein